MIGSLRTHIDSVPGRLLRAEAKACKPTSLPQVKKHNKLLEVEVAATATCVVSAQSAFEGLLRKLLAVFWMGLLLLGSE